MNEQIKKFGEQLEYNMENFETNKCIDCGEEFSNNNVFTEAGWKETKISGLCEKCFDDLFYARQFFF